MNLPYFGCWTSRWTSTRRVLSILSRVTMPGQRAGVRFAFRPSGPVVVAVGHYFFSLSCAA